MENSLKSHLLKKLKEIDQKELKDYHVVLLPDFFIDHFLTLNEFNFTFTQIKNIYDQGGGNLPDISQRIHQGGNAANTALALAKLGVKSHLICRTDKFGLHLLKFFLGRAGVDLKGVKTDGQLAITTALEFGKKHTNVMIGEVGSTSDFSFNILDENDLNIISNSDLLCILTWNLNKKGTVLAKDAFKYAKKQKVKTFFDTGDPSPKENEIPDLIENVLSDSNLDILGLNENELCCYTNVKIDTREDIINAAILLKNKIKARIDLHTESFSCTLHNKQTIIPTLNLANIYRSTGAGDTWNAGDIFAELLGFTDEERLLFANFVAGYYISSPDPIHPTLRDIIKFISNSKHD